MPQLWHFQELYIQLLPVLDFLLLEMSVDQLRLPLRQLCQDQCSHHSPHPTPYTRINTTYYSLSTGCQCQIFFVKMEA